MGCGRLHFGDTVSMWTSTFRWFIRRAHRNDTEHVKELGHRYPISRIARPTPSHLCRSPEALAKT